MDTLDALRSTDKALAAMDAAPPAPPSDAEAKLDRVAEVIEGYFTGTKLRATVIGDAHTALVDLRAIIHPPKEPPQ